MFAFSPIMQAADTAPRPKPRLAYFDNLRGVLAVLVVVHHAILPYGIPGGHLFPSHTIHNFLSPPILINASFLMMGFFFASGVFFPISFNKGAGPFLRSKLIRIGIPMLFGCMLYLPFLKYWLMKEHQATSFFQFLTDYYFTHFTSLNTPCGFDFAHLWFLEHLLLYSLFYAGICMLWPRPVYLRAPGPWGWVIITVVLAVLSFFIRLWYPLGTWTGLLYFIQAEPGHLPHYAGFLVLGILAGRNGWLDQVSTRMGYVMFAIFMTLALGFWILYLCGVEVYSLGWLNWVNVRWSLIESTMAICATVGLLVVFRNHENWGGRVLKFLADNSYGVYILHIGFVVSLQHAIHDWPLHTLLKALLVTAVGVPMSYLATYLVRKIPGVQRVL